MCAYKKVCAYKKGALNNPSLRYIVSVVCTSVCGDYCVHGVLQCLIVSVLDLLVCTVSGVSMVLILSMVSYTPPT